MFRKFALAAALVIAASPAYATTYTGTLYYTYFSGGGPTGHNVSSVTFSYDDVAHSASLGPITGVANVLGADGIIFDANGHLLVGGQGYNRVHQVDVGTGAEISTGFLNTNSYHLTLDPTGTKVYTSSFGGPLETLALTPLLNNAVQTNITGGESGITQVAFGQGGAVFYVNSQPNGGGSLGTIDINTGVTTRIWSNVNPAHGLIYDPFTGLMTMFGRGYTGTMNASNGSGLKVSGGQYNCDFDQGAVDGHGHALVAGCNSITLIDYSQTGDITDIAHNLVYRFAGFTNIDDVAPLVGAGSQHDIPEPASLALLGLGLAGLGIARRRRRTA